GGATACPDEAEQLVRHHDDPLALGHSPSVHSVCIRSRCMPGRLFSRFARKRARTSPWTGGQRKDVLFLFDQPGAWTRYRCDHQAEAAELAGLSCALGRTECANLLEAVG